MCKCKNLDTNILPHSSPNLVVTSKGTLNPDPSKIIDGNSSVFIRNVGIKNTIGINTDGIPFFSGKKVSIEISKSDKIIKFLILENYISQWNNKILKEQGFNL